MHIDLIGPYIKPRIQHNMGGNTIKSDVILICMTMIGPATCWFEIVKLPTFDLNEVLSGNDEYFDESSTGVSQLFNNL